MINHLQLIFDVKDINDDFNNLMDELRVKILIKCGDLMKNKVTSFTKI